MSGVNGQWCVDSTDVSASPWDSCRKQQWSTFSPPPFLPHDSFPSSWTVSMTTDCLPPWLSPAHRMGTRRIQERQDHRPEKGVPTKTIQPKFSQIRQAYNSILERSLYWLTGSLSNSLIIHPSYLSHVLPVIRLFLPQYFQCRTKQSNSVWELLCQKTANGRSHPLSQFAQLFDFLLKGFVSVPSQIYFSLMIKHSKNSCTIYYDNYYFIHWQMKVLASFPPN